MENVSSNCYEMSQKQWIPFKLATLRMCQNVLIKEVAFISGVDLYYNWVHSDKVASLQERAILQGPSD